MTGLLPSVSILVVGTVLISIGWVQWKKRRKESIILEERYQDCIRQLSNRIPLPTSLLDSSIDDETHFRRRSQFFRHLCPQNLQGVDYFHVAGTNGKGSVCELLRCCLGENGRRVGTFTSPHIHTLRERIRIGDKMISKADLVHHVTSLQETFDRNPWLIFFDKLLAVALLHFAMADVNALVLEVGIGGKYDSTNFFERPAKASIITHVSYDHQALLGNSLQEISSQKAGIIKPGTVVFSCDSQPDPVRQVIEEVAKAMQVELVLVGPDKQKAFARNVVLKNTLGVPSWVLPDNLALAEAAAACAGLTLKGFDKASWPCRFEVFDVGPMRTKLVIDGAHNEGSVHKLMLTLAERFPGRQVHRVFGAAADKDLVPLIQAVCLGRGSLFLVHAHHPRAANTEELRKRLPAAGVEEGLRVCELKGLAVEKGLELAMQACDNNGVVVVCGSFFVASQAREWLAREYPSLFNICDWVYEADL